MDFFGSLIGAGANLLGGLLGQNSAKDTADANRAAQYDFAQNQLTWKAADARNAETKSGINPLALLGASTSSFSNIVGDNSLGSGVASAGQDLGRAANALTTKSTRLQQLNEDLVTAQIANVNSDTVKNQAAASQMARRVPATPGVPAPLFQKFSDGHGGVVTLPSKDASQAMQNWASMPAQIGVAAGEVGHSLMDAYHSVVTPWINKFGSSPVRGDVLRPAQSIENYGQF